MKMNIKIYQKKYRSEHKNELKAYAEKYHKLHRQNDMYRHKAKMNNIKRLYNLTEEQYNQLLIYQNNRCAICKEEFINVKICIDHNHVTKKIRGLLCDNCNMMLGKVHDHPAILFNAIKYLESNNIED